MSAYVVVHFSSTRGASNAPSGHRILTSGKVKRLLAHHGAVLLDNPGTRSSTGDAIGVSTLSVSDMDRASRLADALRAVEGVESAYAKPTEELP